MEPNPSFSEVGAEDNFYFTEFLYLGQVWSLTEERDLQDSRSCERRGKISSETASNLNTAIYKWVAQSDKCGFDGIMETSPVCEKSADINHHTNGLILQKHMITTDVAKAFDILHPFVIKYVSKIGTTRNF